MIVYGRNVALEIFKKKKKVRKIYLQENFNDERLNSYLESIKIPIKTFKKNENHEFEKYNHQGILLDIEEFSYESIDEFLLREKENKKVLILDHLEDSYNIGAIIRSAEAGGMDGVIIPKDRSSLVNSIVIKTSAGSIFDIPIILVTNINQTIKKLKENNYWIIATDLKGTDYRTLDYKGNIALIIGNESRGVSNLTLRNSDYIITIPMYGKTNSLNASVAAGILIYEVVNKRE